MTLMLGANPCKTCKHSKLAHKASLGVCTAKDCECKLYLSGEYPPTVQEIKLMGQPGKSHKRERSVVIPESKLEDMVIVAAELFCIECGHSQAWHEFLGPVSAGGCSYYQCECSQFIPKQEDQAELWDLPKAEEVKNPDAVNHPPHYTSHSSGVECIAITEHMSFCVGNAVKYLWRADLKGGLEDLRKAAWYIQREIERRTDASA